MSSITPHLGLTLPGVLSTVGPTWASQVNADLSLVDSHTHTETSNQVPSAGININADLSYTGYGPINQSYSRFTAGAIPSAGTLVSSVFVSAGDLYYQNGSGTNIQLTSGSTIGPSAATASNGFTASPGSFNAGQALFNTAANTYQFYTDTAHTTLAYLYADRLTLKHTGGGLIMGTAGTSTTPTGGWTLSNASSSYLLAFDDGTGAYNVPALCAYPSGEPTQSYYYGFNAGTTPGYPIDVRLQQTQVNSQREMLSLALGSTAGGAVTAGYGPGIVFRANTNSAAPTTYLRQGAVRGFWSAVGTNGGVRIHGAQAGTQTTTAGIEVVNTGALDCVGIGGAANSSYALKVYGDTNTVGSIAVTGDVISTGRNTGNDFAVASTAATTVNTVYNRRSLIKSAVVYNDAGIVSSSGYNVTSIANNAGGDNTITWNYTLASTAVILVWCSDAFVTVKATSGGAGSGTLRLVTSDNANHTVQVVVTGG